MILELPFPPTTNTYWRHIVIGKSPRTLISEKGRKYRQTVIDECLVADTPHKLTGPLACTLDLYPPCNRRRDCDNHAKALLDALGTKRDKRGLLITAGIYDDDSQILDLRIRMHPKEPPGKVVVTLKPISDQQYEHAQMDLMG